VVDINGSLFNAPKRVHFRLGARLLLGCAGLALLAGCASGGNGQQARSVGYYEDHAHHSYAPPGPASDPWGPYIDEASTRFDVPAQWIRQVMRVESGGHEYINGQLTVSSAGAMGLMQLEPETYQEMAAQFGLGSDPFNPYDNIMAGTAYIHAMYQVYGSPGFLAAYDAGPGRLNSYMNNHSTLPDETVNYVAMIAPHIQGYYPTHRSEADELALNTMPEGRAGGLLPPGFVPNSPSPESLAAPEPVEVASNTLPPPVYSAPAIYTASSVAAASLPEALPPPPPPSTTQSSVVVASVLEAPQTALPSPPPSPTQSSVFVASALEAPQSALPPPPPASVPQHHHFSVIPAAMADTLPPPPPRLTLPTYALQTTHHHSGWAIQVGAYDTSSHAQAALGIAELSAVQMLMGGHPMVISVHASGHTKYRARFVGLMRDDAVHACSRLSGGPTGCVVLSPEEQS
jgi:hypothetical protein